MRWCSIPNLSTVFPVVRLYDLANDATTKTLVKSQWTIVKAVESRGAAVRESRSTSDGGRRRLVTIECSRVGVREVGVGDGPSRPDLSSASRQAVQQIARGDARKRGVTQLGESFSVPPHVFRMGGGLTTVQTLDVHHWRLTVGALIKDREGVEVPPR